MTINPYMVTPLWCNYLAIGYSVSMKNNIKVYRKAFGLSCNDLGSMVGFSQQRISRYELGSREPGLKECRLIVWAFNALGLDVSVDDVFPEEWETTDTPEIFSGTWAALDRLKI